MVLPLHKYALNKRQLERTRGPAGPAAGSQDHSIPSPRHCSPTAGQHSELSESLAECAKRESQENVSISQNKVCRHQALTESL